MEQEWETSAAKAEQLTLEVQCLLWLVTEARKSRKRVLFCETTARAEVLEDHNSPVTMSKR